MSWSLFDHVFVFAFVVVAPSIGYLRYAKVKRRLAEDKPGVRVQLYKRTMRWQLLLGASGLAVWVASGRPLSGLGLAWPGTLGTWIVAALVMLALVGLRLQVFAVFRHDDLKEQIIHQAETEVPFLPRDNTELGWFIALAITAGVCEELLYRGYLLAYLGEAIGVVLAVVAAGVVFGLGHAYQGPRGILKTGVLALVAGTLYSVAGSLFPLVLLHAAVDINAGLLYRVATAGRSRVG